MYVLYNVAENDKIRLRNRKFLRTGVLFVQLKNLKSFIYRPMQNSSMVFIREILKLHL